MNHHRSAIVNYDNDSALNLHLAMHQDKSDIKFNESNMKRFLLTPIEQVPTLNKKIAKHLDLNGNILDRHFKYIGTTRTKQEKIRRYACS